MTARPLLRLLGADVALERRLPDGRAVVRYLDRDGAPTPFTAAAWPHELRGIGWHIAEIKARVEALPLQGAAPIAPTSPRDLRESLTPDQEPAAPQPRGFLHAHFSAAED